MSVLITVGNYKPNPPAPTCQTPPPGDLNNDCKVDEKDFAVIANNWQQNNMVTPRDRWTPKQAWQWYDKVGYLSGCNYVPRSAISDTEMWQAETFDPETIDLELGWAQNAGINSVRVFMQYLVYEDDPDGYIDRLDKFLAIAHSHNISTIVALFSNSYGVEPFLGPQPKPFPGIHSNGWVQSPGYVRLQDHYRNDLKNYVIDVIRHFANDQRVLIWDLFNEPYETVPHQISRQAYLWARSANPSQPLTTSAGSPDLWDVATYHSYGGPFDFASVDPERPVICTETIYRYGANIQLMLPAFAENGVGWYMWGLAVGKALTPGYDLLQSDGTPFNQAEIDMIRKFPKMFVQPPHPPAAKTKTQKDSATPSPEPTCILVPRGDLNEDCKVDLEDFALLLQAAQNTDSN